MQQGWGNMSDHMDQRHQVVIIGGGTGGITVAARLKKAGMGDIALIEPADTHYYQPLWTLVGGGRAKAADSARPMSSVIPKGITWVKDSVVSVNPEERTVRTALGKVIGYDRLVVSPGIQLNWGKIPGLEENLGKGGVSSNYRYDLSPGRMCKGQKTAQRFSTNPWDPSSARAHHRRSLTSPLITGANKEFLTIFAKSWCYQPRECLA